MGWQWHQLDHMQIICTSFQTDNHASTSPLVTWNWNDNIVKAFYMRQVPVCTVQHGGKFYTQYWTCYIAAKFHKISIINEVIQI